MEKIMNDTRKANALFIDTTNSARSQMGEALLRHYAGDRYNVYSAGVDPQPIDPRTVVVMEEDGIPLTGQEPQGLRTYLGQKHFGYVFTVCDYAQSQCPTAWLQAQHHLHWDIPDPLKAEGTEEEVLDAFRESRDQLDEHIRAWLDEQT
jgi:arsenate reductase (thioredoxin)